MPTLFDFYDAVGLFIQKCVNDVAALKYGTVLDLLIVCYS